jgi:pectin methylesterase-like acyl-CoA thioesterase
MMLSAGTAAAMYQIPMITVDDSGGADFTSIQAAVDAASERAMVEVRGSA